MRKDRFFNILAILLVVVAVLQIGGLYFEIYKQIEWWDTMTHFLGGAWIGGMALWFLFRKKDALPAATSAILISLVAAFAIGLGWELYEFVVVKILGPAFPIDYVSDTITDLVADSAGGLPAAFLFLELQRKCKTV